MKSIFTTRMFKGLVLSILTILSIHSVNAQVNGYGYSTGNGVPLQTGSFTNLLGTFLDDDVSAQTNIGFTFNYGGVNYTQFSATSNGVLNLGGIAATDYNNVFSNFNSAYLLPYWDDNYTDANGSVQYLLVGPVGSRKLIVDYNLSYLGNTGTADKHFQIWLFETSNIVEFVYGAGNNLNGGFSCGILTNGTTDFISVTTGLNTASTVIANDGNTTWPGNGTFYIFNPLASSSPEINIKGNSVSIVDGDLTPSVLDDTDFGSIATCSGTSVKTYTIENTGTTNLTLSVPVITGTGFSLTSAPVSPVTAGGSTTFQVTFDPSVNGLSTGTVTMANNDTDENPYNFSIQGTGIADLSAPVISCPSNITAYSGEILLANYVLSDNLLDATGNFGPITLSGNPTPPAIPTVGNGVCSNGIYFSSPNGQNIQTPNITGLNASNFSVDVQFKINNNNVSIITGGSSWRWIGLDVNSLGNIGILYNNSNYSYSTTNVSLGIWHTASLRFASNTARLYLDGVRAFEKFTVVKLKLPPVFNTPIFCVKTRTPSK